MKSKLCLLLLFSSFSLVRADGFGLKNDEKNIIVGGAVVVAVLGVSTLIYKLLTREPSNEKLLSRSRETYESLQNKYGNMELLDQAEGLARCTEQDLATLVYHKDIRVIPFVVADCATLQAKIDLLQERVYRESGNGKAIIYDMRVQLRNMKQFEQQLKHLKQFWQAHSTFFNLYHQVKNLADRYDHARCDVYDVELVRRAVMEMSVQSRTEYPYLRFGEVLRRDVDELKRGMRNAERYEVLYGKADRLLEPLTALLGTVASLKEYQQEIYLRQQHKLEQERVDAMREKARAERMKADALAQQAAAERQKAQAMREQAQAEQRTAQAIEDKNLIAMMNPQQPTNVTVTLNAPMNSELSSEKTDPDCN